MSEHSQTLADLNEAAGILQLRYQCDLSRSLDGLEVDIALIEPRHAVRLRAIGDKTVSIQVFHHVNRGPDRPCVASETIRDYSSPHGLATRTEAIYQATLPGE